MLEQIVFPEPVIAVAIEPKTKADQEKLATALQRLAEEDPTFMVESDEETGQTLIHGMGELHLEVLVDRMMREFNVEANVGKPQVAYRETIRKEAKKVDAPLRAPDRRLAASTATWSSTSSPNPGEGFEFESKIKGGTIPTEFIPSVEKGIVEALVLGDQGRLPDGRRQGRADRRLLPRRRLLRDGLQDRRLDGDPGRRQARQARCCSSR